MWNAGDGTLSAELRDEGPEVRGTGLDGNVLVEA
jgi:hypothetical protein